MDESTVQADSRRAVLMPALLPEPFDYLVPEGTADGTLVEAPLAGRKLIGVVWEGKSSSIPESKQDGVSKKSFKLKEITRTIPNVPPLSPRFRQWIDWVADFTLAPKGAVLMLCGLASAGKSTRTAYQEPTFKLNLPTLKGAQSEVAAELTRLIETCKEYNVERFVKGEGTAEKTTVMGGKDAPDLKPILLDGVTGSGKTEVYFHAIAAALAENGQNGGQNGQVLVLLPEIALTHQWLDRFEKSFGAAPVLWHSRMTPAARARAWQAVANGRAPVVVGARSALFLPFENLKLIVVDEEHDPSYKQEDGVLYHARDMAVVRAHFEQLPVVLVSATPSLETLENIREGKYRVLHLPERFGKAGLPTVKLIDMRIDAPERGDFLSPVVKREMLSTWGRGEQVLLFLNRRGYAPLLLCRKCGHRFQCANCAAWLTVHGRHRLECHHCGHKEPMPSACPACQAEKEMLAPCGPGVERIAEEVRAMFSAQGTPPTLAILSSDESIAAETWADIEAGKIDIIVGTQMVAKGHHFPRLTFVGVVDADVGLSGADLRAGERTYQLLHQLSGRAGRGELPGKVFIQTYCPDHPVMQSLAAQDRDRLMALEAKERKAGAWPPFGQLAAILLDGKDAMLVQQAGQRLAQSAPSDSRLTVLGPAPAPLSKLRGQFRYRILVKAKPGIHLQRTLKNWLDGQKFAGVRIKIDVNPYYFM